MAVTERKTLHVAGSNFTNNTLLWRELAAGGGLYCLLCDAVNISGSLFSGNRAAYGGGAALLQPWRASTVSDSTFAANTALPDPLGDLPHPAQRRRRGRALLDDGASVATGGGAPQLMLGRLFSGPEAPAPDQLGGAAAAAAILGPIGANVTGDSGTYTGGGGLYLSVAALIELHEVAFADNAAHNGGASSGLLIVLSRWCRGRDQK